MTVSKPVTRWIGRVQIVQAVLGDDGRDLRADADVARGLVHDDETPGLGHGSEDGLAVDRAQGRKIDDFAADALAVEFGGGAQRFDGHGAPRDDGDIAALAQDEAVIERQRLAVVGALPGASRGTGAPAPGTSPGPGSRIAASSSP